MADIVEPERGLGNADDIGGASRYKEGVAIFDEGAMRIAIPLADETGMVAERFSKAGIFAMFDVHDESRAVAYLGRQTFDQPGCGRTPGFLRQHGVEVVLAHDVSENAVNHLLEAGIVAIQDAPLLTADALIAHLVSGTLQAKPPLMAVEAGGCGGGGCGHCGSHEHAHEHAAEETAAVQACGNHGCASQGCASACEPVDAAGHTHEA